MNGTILGASIARILHQLRHDPRTIGMLMVVPIVLMGLVYAMFAGAEPITSNVLLIMLGLFPFVIMFLITSIAMLRERTSGTLERLMTTRSGKGDLLFGYGIAFGAAAAVQGAVAAACAYLLYGMTTAGSVGLVVLVAVLHGIARRRPRAALLGLRPHGIPSGATTSDRRHPADCCSAGCSCRAMRWPAGCRRSPMCCR